MRIPETFEKQTTALTHKQRPSKKEEALVRKSPGMLPSTPDPRIAALLERYSFEYVLRQVKRLIHLSPVIVNPAVLDLELEEIAQDIHVSFWQKLEAGTVQNPPAYIARMICNRKADILRRHNYHPRPQSLPLAENGELLDSCLMQMTTAAEGMDDPAVEVEQHWLAAECAASIAAALSVLHPRQMQSMTYSLLERADDLDQILEAVSQYGIGIAHWPTDKADEHRLKAILRSARLAMAKQLRVNLALYKMGQGRPAPPLKPCC